MSPPDKALSAVVAMRQAAVDSKVQDLARAEAEVRILGERCSAAEEAVRQKQTLLQRETRAEGTVGFQVAELLRQQAYVNRLEAELAVLRRSRDEARRLLATAERAVRVSRRAISEALGGRQAAEARLAQRRLDARRAQELRREEEAGDQVLARWSAEEARR